MPTYNYPRPALTVDCVVFGLDLSNRDLQVLLIQRKLEPYQMCWALPGGFAHLDETLECAARRELSEETGLTDIYLEQLYTFGAVDRDPRERVVTVAYYALVNLGAHAVHASTDACAAEWFPCRDLPPLAFDHADIVETARQRLRGKVRYQPIGFELLPRKFTLTQLQTLYEIVLETRLDKRNFRKKILGMSLLTQLDEMQTGVAHRAARLYRFDQKRYHRLVESGFNFEL
jgi:8-oxo-dGTP diphosphatase